MLRKLILPVALLGAGGAVAASAASSRDLGNRGALVLRVDLKRQAIRDLPPKGNSAGDLFVDSSSIEHNGKPDGHGHESCVFTFPVTKTRLELQCNEFLALANGSNIAAQGVVEIDFSKGGSRPTAYAITGGTGRYDNVRGEITTKSVGDHEIWTIHLLR